MKLHTRKTTKMEVEKANRKRWKEIRTRHEKDKGGVGINRNEWEEKGRGLGGRGGKRMEFKGVRLRRERAWNIALWGGRGNQEDGKKKGRERKKEFDIFVWPLVTPSGLKQCSSNIDPKPHTGHHEDNRVFWNRRLYANAAKLNVKCFFFSKGQREFYCNIVFLIKPYLTDYIGSDKD